MLSCSVLIKLQYDLIIWEKSILKKCLHFVEIVLKSILKIRGNGAFKDKDTSKSIADAS